MIKRHCLSFKQNFHLCEFLRNLNGLGKLTNETPAKVAKLASHELNFSVSELHVRNAAEIIEVDWPNSAPKKIEANSVEALKQHVVFLYRELGLPIPNDLTN